MRLILFCVLAMVAACAGQQQSVAPSPEPQQPDFIEAADDIKTIQLYAATEQDLPFLGLRDGSTLTLEFDLMTMNARPLSIYFYHTDRRWKRDLSPGEYMEHFLRDDLLDYTLSQNTQNAYSHYRYRFPNDAIDFRISGNYVLRVTEKSSEYDVLFERPFFVSEGTAQVAMNLDLLLTGTQVMPVIQPQISVTPPPDMVSAVFDLVACFIEGGQVFETRCTRTPRIGTGAAMLYYLEPEAAYGSRPGDYLLDLERLVPGGDIERVNLSTVPYTVLLQPDYARFPDTGTRRLLNGQSVISEDDDFVDVSADYAEVTFRYVPPNEQPLPGNLYVTGSFNNWQINMESPMQWHAEGAWYETAMVIKQGVYEYRFTSVDATVQRMLESRLHRHVQWYTGLVYFRDHILGTDRLLARTRVLSQ